MSVISDTYNMQYFIEQAWFKKIWANFILYQYTLLNFLFK